MTSTPNPNPLEGYQSPVSGYQILVRLRIQNRPGNLGRVTTVIGAMGADVSSVDIVEARTEYVIRDLRLFCPDEASARAIVGVLSGMDDIEVVYAADRTFELHHDGKITVENRVHIRNAIELNYVNWPGAERVSEYLRNLQNNSPFIERPELIEIKVAGQTPQGVQRRLFEFTLNFFMRPTPERAQLQSGKNAPRPAPAAGAPATPAVAAAKK